MIKTIFFDIGGVYATNSTGRVLAENLSKNVDLDKEKCMEIIIKFDLDFMRGRSTADEFYSNMAKELGTKSDLIEKSWNPSNFSDLNKKILKIITKLKENGYTVAALTDVDPVHDKIRRSNGTYDPFDFVITSIDEGCIKVDGKLYEVALKKTKTKPEESLMIDDDEKKLVVARKYGMKTVLFTNAENLVKDLKKIGMRI